MRAFFAGLAVLALTGAPAASAGPWQAVTPQGLRVELVQDSFRARDGYLLERRYPDGTADATFGAGGAVIFSLGPDNEGPAALRADTQGRLWVAGASAASGGAPEAVVLRFLPQGTADLAYASQGRSAVRPGRLGARALDLLPLPDGGAWVAGLVTEAGGRERAGLWRLGPDGRLDERFGQAGLWLDPDARPAEVLGLDAAGPAGAVRLRLRHDEAGLATAWTATLAGVAAQAAPAAATPAADSRGSEPADARISPWPDAAAPRAASAPRRGASVPAAAADIADADAGWPAVVPIGLAVITALAGGLVALRRFGRRRR